MTMPWSWRLFLWGLVLVMMLLPVYRARAQVEGFISCAHTRTDERIVRVHVALMVGAIERFNADLPSMKSQVLPLKDTDKTPTDANITAMRLTCSVQLPHLPAGRYYVTQNTMPFPTPIPVKVGAPVALGVRVEETAPGLWKASIGKLP